MLKIENLSFSYEGNKGKPGYEVIRKLGLTIGDNEFVCIGMLVNLINLTYDNLLQILIQSAVAFYLGSG